MWKRWKNNALLLIVSMLGCTLLISCIHEPSVPGLPNDRVVVLLDSPPRTVDPRFTIDSTSMKVSRMIFSALTTVDNDALEPRMELAARIEPDESNPTLWHVWVRPGVVFHDGSPLTGEDVAYTYNSILSTDLGSPYRADFLTKFVRVDVDKNDPLHVLFTIRRPYATFRTDLVVGIVPSLLKQREKQTFQPGEAIGTGPFQLVEWHHDRMVSLKRWDAWFLTPPSYQWLVFKTIRDENTRILSLLGGSGDVMVNGVSPILLDVLKEREEVSVTSSPGIGFTYLGLNLRIPTLANPQVRQALSLAIDRDFIIRERFLGKATRADGMLPGFHWAFQDTAHFARYAPDEAKELLDAAGFHPDPETGIRFELELKLSSNRFRMGIARMLVRQWKAIGVHVKLKSFEFSTFFADVRRGRFGVFLLQLPEPIEPDMYRWMLYSQSTPDKEPTGTKTRFAAYDRRAFVPNASTLLKDPECGAWATQTVREGWLRWLSGWFGEKSSTGSANRTYYSNPRFDCLVELGQTETNVEKRRKLYGQVQEILAEELPIIPLWHEDQIAVYRSHISELNLLPTSQLRPVTQVVVTP